MSPLFDADGVQHQRESGFTAVFNFFINNNFLLTFYLLLNIWHVPSTILYQFVQSNVSKNGNILNKSSVANSSAVVLKSYC